MSDPFDIENERIEIPDDEGNTLVFRPVAVVGNDEEMYYVFGAMKTLDDGQTRQMRLMFMKKEEEANGVTRFVACENEREVEHIVGTYLRQAMETIARKVAQQSEEVLASDSECGEAHGVWEFCYCNQPEYLQ